MENLEQILSDYFNNKLADDDVLEVENWINESPDNFKTASQIFRVNECVKRLAEAENIDMDMAFKKVRSKVSQRNRQTAMRVFERIAAILVLPLIVGIGLLVYNDINDGTDQMMEVRTASGMITLITLPDNSKVWLNSNSVLSYPQKFKKNRSVSLEGEAFFNVEKQNGALFTVNCDGIHVNVTGTEFDVEAYPDKREDMRVTLVSGSVEMYVDRPNGRTDRNIMHPGEQISYNKVSDRYDFSKVNTGLVSSWKDNVLYLNDTPILDVLRMIENRYNVEFRINNKQIMNKRFTGTFEQQRLEVILEAFEIATGASFSYGSQPVKSNNEISGKEIIIIN